MQPQQQQPQRHRRRVWLIGSGIAALVLLGCCATYGALAMSRGAGQQAQVPQATATSTPDDRAASFRTYVQLESTALGTDFDAVAANCTADGVLATCRAKLKTAHDTAVEFLQGLDTHPAPPCLAAAEKSLRAGLTKYARGTTLMLDGLDANSLSLIKAGNTDVTQGATALETAAQSLQTAAC